MAFSIFETFTEFLMQDILPVASNPLFWTIILAFSILIALRRVCFPCTTLHGLEHAFAEVDQLFKGYQLDHVSHSQRPPTYNVDAECIMEEELLRIQGNLIDISLRDYNSSWRNYISLSRVWAISSLYKKTCRIQEKIKHLKTKRLQRYNSWNLRLILLRRGHSLDEQFELAPILGHSTPST